MPRKVHYKPNKFIEPCPKCGNNTEFTIHSSQCAEDCCEIWAVCKCGYDPTSYEEAGCGNRVEDVWGGTSDGNCQDAIRFAWNDTIRDNLGELHICQHCGVETREPDEKCYKAPSALEAQ